MEWTNKVCYNENDDTMNLDKINLLADKMRKNEYEVIVCSSKEEAKKIILEMCKDKSVGIGDSHTINDLNILEDLQKQNDRLYAMQLDKSRENKINSMITDIFVHTQDYVVIVLQKIEYVEQLLYIIKGQNKHQQQLF